jgi:metal-dependent amidase/aminoacylase/carboxypeptidase family protein
MFMLGCLIAGDERKHHNASFDIDDRCLPIGVGLLAEVGLRFLRGSQM